MFIQKKRFIHYLPERIRIEVFGVKNNPRLAQSLSNLLTPLPGIRQISISMLTGRVLLYFDECQLSIGQILQTIESFESSIFDQSCLSTLPDQINNFQEFKESTLPAPKNATYPTSSQHEVAATGEIAYLSQNRPNVPPLPLPLPLALTVGGLGFLGVKKLLVGKSALARSPEAFQLAALVSVISGYPKLKQGFGQLVPRRWNLDFILSASTLALALARENLVILAGLSLLQWLKWQKKQAFSVKERPLQTPEIQVYSENAGKMNFLIAGAAWAITQNPYIGLSVLLAGNPRVATIPAEYAWNQAELTAHKHGYYIPEHSSLPEMARTKTVILEDTSILLEPTHSEIQWLGNPEDEIEGWRLAASLMKKTEHPWFSEVVSKTTQFKGKNRAAFKVKSSEQGVAATVHGAEILMGSIKFLQQNGVNCDPYLIDVKRARRHGFEVECIAKNKIFLGCLKKSQGLVKTSLKDTLSVLHKENIDIGFLSNSIQLTPELLDDLHLESFQREGLTEHAALAKQRAQGLFLVTSGKNDILENKSDLIPIVPLNQFHNFINTCRYAQRIDALIKQNFRMAKAWNILGITLGVSNALSAPVINLIGDSLSLLFMSRSKRCSEDYLTDFPRQVIKLPQKQHQLLKDTPAPLQSHSDGLPGNEPWHNMSPSTLLDRFEVNEQMGLSQEKVISLQTLNGLNQLESKKPISWARSYLGQFKEFTTLVVLGTTLLAFFSGDVFDGLAMGSVLLLNAGIGTSQERKAEKVIESLNQYQPTRCKVLRNSLPEEIDGRNLVQGDIVFLEAGDRVPADIRLLQVWNLEANEAALTGESLPVEKQIPILPPDCPLAERKNMLYMGTDITRGKGIGLVVGTGMKTEFGYLMSLIKEQEKLVTPLHEKITEVSKKFVKWAALAGGVVFLVGLLRGRPLAQIIGISITLAASAVPEGLPVTITMALSAGVSRMAKKNALIRNMAALETLGRTTVICTDKTGTLTKNEMTVKKIATLTKAWNVSGDGYEPHGKLHSIYHSEVAASAVLEERPHPKIQVVPKNPNNSEQNYTTPIESDLELQTIAQISLLCNNSQLFQEDGYWKILGDPTEGALLSLAGKLEYWSEKMNHWHRVHEVPFDSNSGTMSVICQDNEKEKECFIFCKGSIETILEHCRWVQVDGEIRPLSSEYKEKILQQNIEFAREALRVLGFAYCPTEWINDEHAFELHKELIYVGLVGMMDPPKIEAEKSIQEATALGVKTVMITGDHPVTAIAIAQKLGFGERASRVLTGYDLDQLSDEKLLERVEEIAIFARVTPEHKLRIVRAYQARGHIVAMTGDGVNDTPAIKQANVGIAMGKTGTEVTKGTADMVLVNDDFNAILEGIKEGRTIIGNIRRAIGCLLTGNLAEILVTTSAVIIGLPMPLVPIQILLMNLLTDAIPAMILAVNPGGKEQESIVTKRQDVVDRELYLKVITRGILLGAASLGLFAVTLAGGAPLPVAQTIAFTSLVVGQFGQTLSWRKDGTTPVKGALNDRYLFTGLGISLLALLSTLYLPPVSRFFRATPIRANHWLAILLIASLVSIVSKPFLNWMAHKTPLDSERSQNIIQAQPSYVA